jgi:starch synthase
MYSLRYGTIPIVHAVGGLVDSVIDVLRFPQTGTGFKFYRYTPEAFLTVVRSALELMQDDTAWSRLLKQAMLQDFSWSRSARAYLEVYESALAESR